MNNCFDVLKDLDFDLLNSLIPYEKVVLGYSVPHSSYSGSAYGGDQVQCWAKPFPKGTFYVLFSKYHREHCYPYVTVFLFLFFNYYYFYCEFLFILYRFVPTLSSFEGYCATTPVIEGRPLSPFSQSITNALSKRRLFRCTVRRDSNPGPAGSQSGVVTTTPHRPHVAIYPSCLVFSVSNVHAGISRAG